MPREFNRSDRVGAQIQREMAEILRVNVRDPELGMVTLSEVELSRDLAVAKLYVSFLGAKIPTDQCVKRLNLRVAEFRHALGRLIRMRVLPELRFVFDDSIERGVHMDNLLRQLGEGDASAESEES